jgi:hypothetical protein
MRPATSRKTVAAINDYYRTNKQKTMKCIWTLILIILFSLSKAQTSISTIDTADKDIQSAIIFYENYLNEFNGQHLPTYSNYWSEDDCMRYNVPDFIVYSIDSDYPTYRFAEQRTIYYARKYSDFVHLKTLFTQVDSSKQITLYAITNHYIAIHDNLNRMHFISPLTINRNQFKKVVNRNITYHFPIEHVFNQQKSDSLLNKIETIEKAWGFQKIYLDYYFADNKDKVAMMKGLDYYLGMDEASPSGMSFDKDRTIFCSGYGEGYLHEILHLYFNPLYIKSPVNHGLIYYLAGGIGHHFDWMIHRMNEYITKYPDTDLSQFESILTKDKMLHIDHTVTGLICKIVDEKEGVAGLKRLLTYSTMDELFLTEFKLQKKDWNGFLKQNFKKYGH